MLHTCSVFRLFGALLRSSSGSKWVCLRLACSLELKITDNNYYLLIILAYYFCLTSWFFPELFQFSLGP